MDLKCLIFNFPYTARSWHRITKLTWSGILLIEFCYFADTGNDGDCKITFWEGMNFQQNSLGVNFVWFCVLWTGNKKDICLTKCISIKHIQIIVVGIYNLVLALKMGSEWHIWSCNLNILLVSFCFLTLVYRIPPMSTKKL